MTHGKAWLAICGMGNRGTNFEVRGHLPCALMLRSGCDNRSRTGVAVANPLNIQSKDIQIIGMHEPLDHRIGRSRAPIPLRMLIESLNAITLTLAARCPGAVDFGDDGACIAGSRICRRPRQQIRKQSLL